MRQETPMAEKRSAPVNRYTRILGYAAAVMLVIGVAGAIATAVINAGRTYLDQVEYNPTVFYIGAGLGVVWLVVKAVLAGRD